MLNEIGVAVLVDLPAGDDDARVLLAGLLDRRRSLVRMPSRAMASRSWVGCPAPRADSGRSAPGNRGIRACG